MLSDFNDKSLTLTVEGSFDGTIMLGSLRLYSVTEQVGAQSIKVDGSSGPDSLCKCPGSWHF